MEPIPETAELVEEFGALYDLDLLAELKHRAEAAKDLVPDLVGVTLAGLEDGLAFTLVASDADVAVLDAVQYVVGGPCAEAPDAERVLEHDSDGPDDEGQWQTFGRASAAKAVASTLTLPILAAGTVVGSVNLYAASGGAFNGVHEELAEIFGAWAPGAVTNADLSFRTREIAAHSAEAVRASMRVETAVGMLMAANGVDADTARQMLEEAARRAGVPSQELAEALLDALQPPQDE